MKSEKFNKVIEDALESSKTVLIKKSAEYANEDNKLHNFDKAARITGKTREECLWGMALKHLVSVTDIIDDMSKDPKYIPSRDLVMEKFGDLRNYLLLLEACIEDKRHNQPLPF
jgi:hypothetical protein